MMLEVMAKALTVMVEGMGGGAVASEKQSKSHRLYSLLMETHKNVLLLSFALRWRWWWCFFRSPSPGEKHDGKFKAKKSKSG